MGGDDSEVYPTDDGILEARRLLDLRTDAVARFRHACDVLLQWVLRTGGRDSAIEVLSYTDDPQCSFAGDLLAEAEALGALDYRLPLTHVRPSAVDAPGSFRSAARDSWKLQNWDTYAAGIDLELRPVVPHLVVDNRLGSAISLTDQVRQVFGTVFQ